MRPDKASAQAGTRALETQAPALTATRLTATKIPTDDTTINTARITWDDLVAREPRLAHLLQEAEQVSSRGNPRFCANAVWYGWGDHPGLKPQLVYLVGWCAQKDDPVLRSERAYDIAYHRIYNALPDCRHE